MLLGLRRRSVVSGSRDSVSPVVCVHNTCVHILILRVLVPYLLVLLFAHPVCPPSSLGSSSPFLRSLPPWKVPTSTFCRKLCWTRCPGWGWFSPGCWKTTATCNPETGPATR